MKILPDAWHDKFAKEQYQLVQSLVDEMPEAVMIVDAQEDGVAHLVRGRATQVQLRDGALVGVHLDVVPHCRVD